MSRPDIPGFPINQINSVQDPNLTSAQDYRTNVSTPTMWAGGRQRPVLSEGEQRSILGTTLAMGAGVFAAGALPYKGQRVWDAYIRAAQTVERASPGQILSTYRASEILSPLEHLKEKDRKIAWGSDFWKDPSRQRYLEKLVGKDLFAKHKKEILGGGVFLDSNTGKLKLASKTQDVTLLSRATKLRAYSPTGQAEFFKNYARSIGAGDLSFVDKSKTYLPIGGKNMLHAYSRFSYAFATEQTNRILRVLPTEIAELPIIRDFKDKIVSRVGPKVEGSYAHKAFRAVFPHFEAGAAHQTIGRYLTKRVLPGVALWKGFQLADYATGHALTGAAFEMYTGARIGKAKMMEMTGLQQLAERQEEIAPGSTSLLGLGAFPAGGMLLGFGAYGARLGYTAAHSKELGWAASARKAADHFKKEDYNTFFGLGKKLFGPNVKKRTLSSAMRRTGALAGLLYTLPFLPGALAGTDTSEDLRAIYSGEKEVAIRKGRWWEMGRTPFEGGRIQYYRKHFIPMYEERAKVKALYGSESKKMLLDPMYNPVGFLMDPYAWEKEHYYEFPFPMTSPAFEDVPFIGPTLAATIGQIVKPSMLMHTEEWLRTAGPRGPGLPYDPSHAALPVGPMGGELEGYGYGQGGQPGIIGSERFGVKRLPRPFGQITAFELGEIPVGAPLDPYSPTQAFGEQAYRFTEMFGLTGFTAGSIKEKLTGRDEFYDQYERLETSRRATGIERAYWDMQIGGGFMSTELFRRLYPHRRRQIDLYNTIRNTQPTWLPGPGEPSPDFLHGFAFGKIAEGEVRLPGRGYAALNPELEGVAPEDYSMIHRYKILADVAPFSPQAKFYKKIVKELQKQGALSESEEDMYQTIQEQHQAKKVFKQFQPRHRFIEQDVERRTVTVRRMIEPGKFEIEEMPGVVVSMAGIKTSHSALTRLAITENNELTQEEAGRRANVKRAEAARMLKEEGMLPGSKVEIEISGDPLKQYAKTTADMPEIRAVVRTEEGVNLNRMLMQAQLAEYDRASAGVLEGQVAFSALERFLGTYWEAGAKALDQPTEFITPFAPGHKFLFHKTRTATEMYAASEAYGTTNAFWDRPWENFLKPAITMFGYKYLGATELPAHRQRRNEVEEYYDKLEYIKYTKLKNEAAAKGDTASADEYERRRNRTAFGANPYGNPLNALLAMQKRDKPYFDAFVAASSEAERDQIMNMLPKYEHHLLRARWNVDLIRQIYADRKVKGSLSPEQQEILEQLEKERAAEGQAVDAESIRAYKSYLRGAGEESIQDYADFQRERSLAEYFESKPLPRADWVGWHPQADLEDIKLVNVQNAGLDMHDFNLWESREKTLPYKPYIDEEAMSQVMAIDQDMSVSDIQATLHDILATYGINDVNITVDKLYLDEPKNLIDLDITRDSLQTGFDQALREGWM